VCNGELWFVGKDVAEALGYADPDKAIRTHCKGVSETLIPSPGGPQTMTIIPERDVYRLIMRSIAEDPPTSSIIGIPIVAVAPAGRSRAGGLVGSRDRAADRDHETAATVTSNPPVASRLQARSAWA